MSDAWSVERSRLALTLLAIPLLGISTSNWALAFALPLLLYIAWTVRQIYKVEKWMRTGAFTGKAPDTNGVWGLIVQHIHRLQRKEKKQKKKLSQIIKRFNASVSALPDATLILNQQLEIEWANKAAEELLGIDRKNDLGLRIGNLIRDPDFSEAISKFEKTMSIELASPVNQSRMIAIRLVRFAKNQMLMTARDISQRVELQRSRKAFVANASHELRTPLTVISCYLEIMESDSDFPEHLKEAASSAMEQAGRMQHIIDDLLVLSRLEGTMLSRTSGERISITAIIGQIVSDMQKTITGQSHVFQLDLDEKLFLLGSEA